MNHVLVIGGDGFLGRWIVELLLRRNSDPNQPNYAISIFDLQQRYFDESLTYYTGNLTQYEDINLAIAKSRAKTLIHTASPPHGLNSKIYWDVNVGGTKNVLKACVENGVEKLVFTSSAGVLYDGISDLVNVDETASFPKVFHDDYHETKAEAEKIVLAANRQNGLLTCAIRPSAIFGPRDQQLAAGMIKVMERGQTKFQIGDNFNLFDFTYVENVAYAHLLAMDKLSSDPDIKVGGEAFLITNGTPIPFWDMPRFIWSQFNHYPPYYIKMSRTAGLALAYCAEWACYLLNREQGFTRYRVKYACSSRYFNINKSKTILGYSPPVDLEEGIKRTCEHLVQQNPKNGK
ncbi:846_t:CDS:2 [Ambispora gerdemannii]|uniref:846_t:CDS:1 n=1 Tax=Ambispora gerdemannii TaxID=144530 RepID=A0A9N8VH32_9GLOM|nr:846_t:CDS:2 [Ambispora gerdemannii]